MERLLSTTPNKSTEQNRWRELAGAARLLMEASWIALLYQGLAQRGGNDTPYGTVFILFSAVLAVGYYLNRWLEELRFRKAVRRGSVAILATISLILAIEAFVYPHGWIAVWQIPGRIVQAFNNAASIPVEFWVMLVILIVWLRAFMLAGQLIEVDTILGSFKLGILALIYYSFIQPGAENLAGVVAFLLFAAFGMLSLSAGRIYESSQRRGGRATGFSRSWVAGILLVIVAVLSLGLLISLGIQNPLYGLIHETVLLLLKLLALLYLLLVSPVLLILVGVLYFFTWLRQVTGAEETFSTVTNGIQQLLAMLQSMAPKVETKPFPSEVRTALLVLALIVIFALLIKNFGWRLRFSRQAKEEEVEEIEAGIGLLDLLRRRARSTGRSMRGLFRLRRAQDWLAAARIRWIYVQLLALSEKLGKPRGKTDTPLEHLLVMNALLPDLNRELELITDAYIQVRYGEIPETEAEVVEVQRAWERVARVGRKSASANSEKKARKNAKR